MDMGEKIHNLRVEKGLTLQELGDLVGVGKSTVRKWENGIISNMRRDKIFKVSIALDTTPAYLMGWEESEESISDLPDIMLHYNNLNKYGKEIATEQVRLLTLDEKYTRPDEPPVPVPSMEEMEARTRQYAPFEMPEGSMPDLIRRINSNKAKDA